MKALLVIDAQNGIINFKDFTEEMRLIEQVIKDFKEKELPVIFMKHLDETEESPLHKNSGGVEIHASLEKYPDHVIEKTTPNAFFDTTLQKQLDLLDIDQLFITGFNTEFCCMFTAISAFDRGYKVTFIEDATGTVNTDETYEMKGLDIKDLIGTVLHWSEIIEVLDFEEYVETYKEL